MKNGIIMEIHRRFLTVLTPDGEFLQVRRQNQPYQIGQEINFIPAGQEKKKVFSFPIKIALTAYAFVLIFISIIPVYQANQVYAYMSIDINPSIELGMNENLKVIELIPYNKDGEKIISSLSNWKRKEVDEVTLEIMNELNKQGYTENKHEVVFSTVLLEDQQKETNKLQKELKVIEKEMAKENLNMILVEASEKDREKAKEKGITTGLYKGDSIDKNDSEKENVESVKKQDKSVNNPPQIQQKQVKPSEDEEVSTSNGKVQQAERKEKNRTSDEVRNNKDYSMKAEKRAIKEEKREKKREEKTERKIEENQIPNQNQYKNNQNRINKDRNNQNERREEIKPDDKKQDNANDQNHNKKQKEEAVNKNKDNKQNNKHEDRRTKGKQDRNEPKNR